MSAPALPVLVVADDHTGANATAGRLAARGVEAVTLPAVDGDAAAVDATLRDRHPTAVVVSTASRHVEPQAAMLAVRRVLASLPAARIVSKRIDTTLRGNIGSELDAVLRAELAAGRQATALVVPAHPDGGRTTVGGVQLVDGQPVTTSEAAADARRPVRASRVTAVLAEQMDQRIAEVDIDTVRAGGAALSTALAADAEVIVADAVDDGDLSRLAHAAVTVAERTGRRWVPCDPGPFTAAFADAAGALGAAPGAVLALVGSVTSVTRAQLASLSQRLRVAVVPVDVADLDGAALARRLAAEAHREDVDVVAAATAPHGAHVRSDLDAAAADRIAVELGRALRTCMEHTSPAGLYLTGGDVTAGALAALDADGLAVDREILPLAVLGRVLGGPHAGTLVATKGGLVGGADAAARCIDELRAAARVRDPSRSTPP